MKEQIKRLDTPLIIDRKQYTIVFNGRKLSLLLKEYELLCLLAEHPGWVYTKEQIFESIYGTKEVKDVDNVIFCLIYSLRQKMEPNPQKPVYIKTVRGVGYKLGKIIVNWKNENN